MPTRRPSRSTMSSLDAEPARCRARSACPRATGPSAVSSCSPAPDRSTATRRSDATSRSRTSPGASRATSIAVLRFDKVTYTHADELKDAPGLHPHRRIRAAGGRRGPTAPAATHLDPRRSSCLGHSLGGTVAPAHRGGGAVDRRADPSRRPGPSRSTGRSSDRPATSPPSTPTTEAAAQPVIAALTEKAQRVDSPALSPSTPASDLPLGAPASYWLDLRDYRPAAARRHSRQCPILILQGGRDYQVTVDDDLAAGRRRSPDADDVTIRVYPSLNHLFSPGDGPSSPAEYEPAQHVDPAVIADITAWVDGVVNPGRTRRGSATTGTAASADTPPASSPTPPGGPGR